MYNSRFNPVSFLRGRNVPRNRRHVVGAEFNQCPDGSWVSGNATAAKCGTAPTGTWGPTGGGTGTGGGGQAWIPTNAGGGGPGTAYTPPSIPTYTPPPVTIPTPTIPTTPGCAPICNVCPEDLKRYYMPFVPSAGYTASVAAGASVVFVGRPQKLFSPDRLIIGSTIGAYFDVVSLTIGNIPQSLSTGNVGAEMFSEVATYVMMTFDQAYPGIDIILTATNKSSVTQTFQAQLIGEAIG